MRPAIYNTQIIRQLTSGYTPDFLIAFTFFTSLCFAIFRKRFNHRSAEAGLSVSLGLALATGLVWWEHDNNLSIRDTGSIGILLSLTIVCTVIYKTAKHSGSKPAAIIITLAAILTFVSLNKSLPINLPDMYALIFAMILLGFIILAVKSVSSEAYSHNPGLAHTSSQVELPDADIKRIHRDRGLNFNLDKHLRKLKNEANLLKRNPAKAPKLYQLISSLLPAEGYLTQRMASLRTKAHQIRSGHIARLKETKSLTKHLPPTGLAQASAKLISSYHKELDMEKRLERLDTVVAANEKKIIEILRRARALSLAHRFKQIPDLIKQAEKLQHQNAQIFKIIERSEQRLSKLAQRIAKQQTEGYKNAKP